MEFWQLGNTSVRSAMRIKDGLTAYSTSSIQGNIRKGDGDIAFRRLLGQCGVVSLGKDSTNSVGRKWRSAMGKLGFIYPVACCQGLFHHIYELFIFWRKNKAGNHVRFPALVALFFLMCSVLLVVFLLRLRGGQKY